MPSECSVLENQRLVQRAIRYWDPDLACRCAEMGANTHCVKIVECMPARPIGSEHGASATAKHIRPREIGPWLAARQAFQMQLIV